jgi:hypothetical protein
MSFLFLLALAGVANALPWPQGIMDSIMGPAQTGIFGSGGATSAPSLSLSGITGMLSVAGMTDDRTGGSGPYKSSYKALAGLDKHTVYQPLEPPVGVKLPVIVWGKLLNSQVQGSATNLISSQGTGHVAEAVPGSQSSLMRLPRMGFSSSPTGHLRPRHCAAKAKAPTCLMLSNGFRKMLDKANMHLSTRLRSRRQAKAVAVFRRTPPA